MTRPLRIDQEDTFYHVLNRGNERRAIFRDDGDREGFLKGGTGSDLAIVIIRARSVLAPYLSGESRRDGRS